MKAIEIGELTKCFGALTAVDHVSLVIEEGELFALLGINGAGKTTMLRMLMGLVEPTSGTAVVMGHDILTDLAAVKQLSGLSPQFLAVAPHLTVRENLTFMAQVYGLSGEEMRRRVETLLGQFLLTDVADRRAKALSGGYSRRLSIAMALVGNPRVLYLDEPTLGLDVIARRELWKLVEALKGDVTIILTTHYMEEAEAISDRIAIMAEGRLLAVDTPDTLKAATGCTSVEDAFIAVVEAGGLPERQEGDV